MNVCQTAGIINDKIYIFINDSSCGNKKMLSIKMAVMILEKYVLDIATVENISGILIMKKMSRPDAIDAAL